MGSLFWIVVCVLSPTRLIIEIIKKWQFVNYGKLLKLWNPGFLLVSIATCIYLSYIPKINDIANLSYGLALYILWMPFSRTFEIAYAFFLDAHDKLLNRESSTDLKFTDRI